MIELCGEISQYESAVMCTVKSRIEDLVFFRFQNSLTFLLNIGDESCII